MHKYRIKTIKALLTVMILFLIVFLIALLSEISGKALFEIGIVDAIIVNYTIMILCLIAIIRVVLEIVRVEHKSEYEERVRNSKI